MPELTAAEKTAALETLLQDYLQNRPARLSERSITFKTLSILKGGDEAARTFVDAAYAAGSLVNKVEEVAGADGGCDLMEAKLVELGYNVTPPE